MDGYPFHQNISMRFLHTGPWYISWGADGENLSNIQELLRLMMISFYAMTLKFHSGVIL